jgi:Tfp pilus assembly protein PilP
MNGADIEALAFLVLMAASKSAQGDLKAFIAEVNAMCQAKQELRQMMAKVLAIVLSATGPGATEKRAKLMNTGSRCYYRGYLRNDFGSRQRRQRCGWK